MASRGPPRGSDSFEEQFRRMFPTDEDEDEVDELVERHRRQRPVYELSGDSGWQTEQKGAPKHRERRVDFRTNLDEKFSINTSAGRGSHLDRMEKDLEKELDIGHGKSPRRREPRISTPKPTDDQLNSSLDAGMDDTVPTSELIQVSTGARRGLRTPSLPLPRYEDGDDWREFIESFRDFLQASVVMSELEQVALFKSIVPRKGKNLISSVHTLREAVEILTEVYEPEKGSDIARRELYSIKQEKGEALPFLINRIASVARRHARVLHIAAGEMKQVVAERFVAAVSDELTRRFLRWEWKRDEDISLKQLVRLARSFQESLEDEKMDSAPAKRVLAATGVAHAETASETKTLQELQGLREEMAQLKLQLDKKGKSSARPFRGGKKYFDPNGPGPRIQGNCYLCGEVGHQVKYCPQRKSADKKSLNS